MKQSFVRATVLAAIFFTATNCFANNISKQQFLTLFVKAFPDFACNQLTSLENAQQVDLCKRLMPNIIKQCASKLASPMPSTLNKEQRRHWGRELGKCTTPLYLNSSRVQQHFVYKELMPYIKNQVCTASNLAQLNKLKREANLQTVNPETCFSESRQCIQNYLNKTPGNPTDAQWKQMKNHILSCITHVLRGEFKS